MSIDLVYIKLLNHLIEDYFCSLLYTEILQLQQMSFSNWNPKHQEK